MLPLLVRIRHRESGAQRDAGFRRSPVRIGRNQLNDLALDEPFVSQWHGIVRFDEEGTRFLDVGSTNGTVLDGARLEKNTEVELTDQTELVIGPLSLTFVRMPLDDSQILSRRASPFSLGGTSDAGKGHAATGTLMLSGSQPPPPIGAPPSPSSSSGAEEIGGATLPASAFEAQAARSPEPAPGNEAPPAAANAPPPRVGPAIGAAGGIGAMAARMAAKMSGVTAKYEKHEAAREELEAAIREALAGAINATEKRGLQSGLRDAVPRGLDHAEIRQLLGAEGATGDLDAASWLGRLVGPALAPSIGDPPAGMERAGALLEAFATAYVALIAGQHQVSAQLSVESGGERSPLHAIGDARTLLAYLLDQKADFPGRLDELSRAFADIVVHQLGMLNGVVQGARALMLQISPQGIGAVPAGALVQTSPGFGDYLWPFRAAGRYYRYAQRHMELSGEAQLTKILFGGAFSKAYYRVTGARGGAPARQNR